MSYLVLPEQLWPVADAARGFFERNWGVSRVRAEVPVDDSIDYRPTLTANVPDYHYLCVEVSESVFPVGLEAFILGCLTNCLPVRLFTAVPGGLEYPNYKKEVARAQQYGVGVIEVSSGRAKIVQNALSLSLLGVRPIPVKMFPKKLRFALSQAETTFRAGDPAKGCSDLFDEIEALCRTIAEKTHRRGLWRAPRLNESAPKVNFHKAPWASVVKALMDWLDPKKCGCIHHALLGRILGVTSQRNDSAHKPRSRADLVRRDRELRTRFESASDMLLELTTASRTLHL